MKKLVSIIILCLGCLGILEAQNIWKPINGTGLLGVGPDGSIFAYGEYGTLSRSQDDGETWQIVLGQETGFTGHINSSCFAVSNEGRICVFNDNQQTVVFSDDNGDTWQQTTSFSSCAMPDKTGLCVPTNDIMVVWAENGEISYSLDGGETWDGWILDFLENSESVSDLLVNENGDVYVSVAYYIMNIVGIYHSTLTDIQNWELVAFEGISIKDMVFDPEGNVVACGYNADGSSDGFQHAPGFYLFDGTTLAISDGGIVYRPYFVGNQAVLSYSTDHGEHFTEIGEHLPLVDIAPGGENPRLFKGYDNHLYFDGGGEYWKSLNDADEITSHNGHFAPLGAEWYFHVWSQGPITEPPFSYIRKTVSGVEEVQGHTCSVIDLYDYVYEEDNIVYWYNQDNDAFTVLYDFNAEAGESWYCDITGCSFLVTVQSVDSVTWNNRTYRTQYVAGCYADNLDNVVFQGRIIDGIGYEKGLFFNWGSCGIICGADYEYMRCYLEDGELLYHEGDYDCDYVPGNQPQQPQFEWYYEIENEDGSITYQYMYQAGDTIINDEPTHILVKINTLYDKGLRDEVTHEYVYERDGKVYWWNKTLEVFTVLYDYEAEVGDYWEIVVGTRTIDMHVDAVEEIEYEGRVWRMLRVSDPEDLFSGNIVCGIGHLTSFFPEKLMGDSERIRVEGMRCYWNEGELVFKYGDEDCDAIYSDVHGVEEDGLSTGSGALTVYPNPTNHVLFIETRLIASLPDQTYHITNLMGQTLLTGQITAENQQINVSSLPQGMYFISVGDVTRKFVVR